MVTSDYEVEHGGSDVAESHFVAESVSAVSALPHGDHRLRHTQHVLGQLRVFLWSSPSELDATIRCSDGDVQANKVVLAAVSKFLRCVCRTRVIYCYIVSTARRHHFQATF